MRQQVFISYRRQDGFYPAYLLYKELVENGYSVFFDIKSLRQGAFPEILRQNIEECSDFLLLVTKTTFSDRIFREEDWIRRELRLALEHQKNIVTIFIDADIPERLPADIAAIRNYNGIRQIDPNLIGENYRRLFRDFMVSRPVAADKGILNRRCSIYSADYGDEFARLQIQALNSLQTDEAVLKQIRVGGTVLDVGCAYGTVTQSRFSAEKYTAVVGVDKNEACLAVANRSGGKFSFLSADLEAPDFSERLAQFGKEHGIAQYDLIFSSLVLHHLKDPYAVLRKLRRFLSPKGYLVLRGSDDGSKLAYPDEHGYLRKIIDRCLALPGISDRLNGRKLFDWLSQSGYRNVRIRSFLRDTSNLSYDERENLFRESFSYRINYFRKIWEEEPENKDRFAAFDEMETLLALFEREFMRESFWYGEYDYVGIAQK